MSQLNFPDTEQSLCKNFDQVIKLKIGPQADVEDFNELGTEENLSYDLYED